MKRYRRPASAVRRIRNRLLPGAGAAIALIVAWAMTASGTLSLWQERHIQLNDLSVSAGTPGLEVDGFHGLDFDYAADALTTEPQIIEIINIGNVPLSGFEATRSNVSGNPEVTSAPTAGFTPLGGGASTDWDGWLEGLTLAPGDNVKYNVTTTLSSADFARLKLQEAVTEVTITATAGTTGGWQVSASETYTQAVAEPVTPGWDDFNTTLTIWSTTNFELKLKSLPAGATSSSKFQVFANGVLLIRGGNPLTTPDLGYWNLAQSIDSSMIPQAVRPASGQTVPIELTVTMDGAIVARGTILFTNTNGHYEFSAVNAPQSAAAPMAMSAPIAPTRAAAPAPAPAAPAPVVPAAPAPTTPPEPPKLPAPEAPVVGPNGLGEEAPDWSAKIENVDDTDPEALKLSWQTPAPDGVEFGLQFPDGTLITSANGEFPAEMVPEPWRNTSDEVQNHEVVVVVVRNDVATPTDTTVWVSVDTGGVVSFHTSPVEASASSIEDAE